MFGPRVITSCPDHGTTEVDDKASFIVYVNAALSCSHLSILTPSDHAAWHGQEGHSCWVCCDRMVIDPEDQA